ncbi:hypothetical protein [Chitinimonas lacunae]|uniref:Peptidase n=1 Tax=Chitinimonas lacunae TaxID=1963018 RepID=A0ABV8ML38_9NEIS
MKTYRPTLIALCVASLGAAYAAPASDLDQAKVREFLEQFHRSPAAVMDQQPAKTNQAAVALFSAEAIKSKQYIEQKNALRNWMLGNGQGRVGARSAIQTGNDNPARLVDNGNQLISNIHTMDEQKLTSAKLSEQPWSDTYWPLYNGSLGNRYADSRQWNYPTANWKDYWTFANQTLPVKNYIDANQINLLSPSEKYDLLVGDDSYGLTLQMWNSGKGYFDRNGSVEAWMGLCHGWAPAAYVLPRPKKSIEVTGVNGHKITFYPSDIKALGTLLWANASPSVRFVGGRCNVKDPAKDTNGRITDQNCFDNNPGSWHQTVINQIGVSKRSFVFDATYDYEVWNQPVLGYSYVYFNPETGQTFNTAKEALIAKAAYTKDKFSKYRNAATQNIVGVRMQLSYLLETSPSHATEDSPNRDYVTQTTYTYDLELDASGKIIGGEWYGNRHPDFVWTPAPNARALSYYNPSLTWTAGQALPAGYKQAAQSSSRYSQPVTNVVEQLFRWSSQ